MFMPFYVILFKFHAVVCKRIRWSYKSAATFECEYENVNGFAALAQSRQVKMSRKIVLRSQIDEILC